MKRFSIISFYYIVKYNLVETDGEDRNRERLVDGGTVCTGCGR